MSAAPRRTSVATGSNPAILAYQQQQLAAAAAGGAPVSPGATTGESLSNPTTPKSARRHVHTRERSFTASDIDISAADLLIPPEEWAARALRLHPEVLQMREQLRNMLGEDSFSRQSNVSTTEIKDSIHPDIVMALIDNFLTEHGLVEASKTLRSESQALSSTNPRLMTERLLPDDLLKLIRLGMFQDIFQATLEDTDDPELESLESYATDYEHDVNLWQEESNSDTIVFEGPPSGSTSNSQHHGKSHHADTGSGTNSAPGSPYSGSQSTPPIKAATLNQLVIQLTSAKSKDLDFKRCFFGTLHSFATPTTVLRKLIERYRYSKRIGPGSQATNTVNPALSSTASTLPPLDPNVIISCINYWLDTYTYDFTDAVRTQLGKFIDNDLIGGGQRHLAHKMQACLTKLESARQQQKQANQDKSDVDDDSTVTPAASARASKKELPPEPKVPKNVFSPLLSLADIDEEEIARQLTILDFELFSIIQLPEFYRKRWVSKNGKNAKRLVAVLNRANNLARWVALSLARELPVTKDKGHVRYLTRMVKLAEHLRSLGNFHSLMAVVTGWNSSLCYQLIETTKKEMPKAVVDTMEVLDKMFDPAKHYKGYKKEFASFHPPCIPSIGLHLQELAWVEEAVPERLPEKEKLINWQKRTQIWEMIREVIHSQAVPYNLVKIHQICDLLVNLDKKVYELSAVDGDEEASASDKLDSQSWLTF